MMRSRSLSHAGWWMLVLLAWGGALAARAQPAIDSVGKVVPVAPASDWPWMVGLLVGGIALGVLGARFLSRRSRPETEHSAEPESALPTAPPGKKRAENVPKTPAESTTASPADNPVKPVSLQSMSKMQGREPRPSSGSKTSGTKGKSTRHTQNSASNPDAQDWTVRHRPAAMNPTQPPVPAAPDDQPLKTGQTIEWDAPTSMPPAIVELLDASAAAPAAAPQAAPATEAAAETPTTAPITGPVHYYAPAPDVPSIEHRKLSPNPLPQMPLLIVLSQADALTAQFSFSPQADQSRIIGNGVRELKEFFTFELPPTEQFTTIKNLAPGKLEKRDDAWHVVQKAEIALS